MDLGQQSGCYGTFGLAVIGLGVGIREYNG